MPVIAHVLHQSDVNLKMPLIVICGLPSSGKSVRAEELRTFFESKGVPVHYIHDSEVIRSEKLNKNEVYQSKCSYIYRNRTKEIGQCRDYTICVFSGSHSDNQIFKFNLYFKPKVENFYSI